MHALHRSGKRLLNKSYNFHFTGLAELPLLPAFLHRCQVEGEPAQKNIVNKSTRHFSVSLEDPIHQSSLRNQHRECHLINGYPDVSLSKHIHLFVNQKRECKGAGLEQETLELAGRVTSSKSGENVDDCAFACIDDCVISSQKTYGKSSDLVVDEIGIASQQKKHKQEICTHEDVLELVVAEAQTSSHRDDKKKNQIDGFSSEVNFLTVRRRVNRFDGSTSELAILDPQEASCKYLKKEKHFVSSMPKRKDRTRKYSSKATERQIVNDSTLEASASSAKLQINRGEGMESEGLKRALDSNDRVSQREDEGMLVKDTSELCLNDTRTLRDERRQEGKRSDRSRFLQGDAVLVKALSMSERAASLRYERTCFAVQKNKKNKKKKKKNWNMVLANIISPVIHQESSGREGAMSGDALKLEDKEEKRENVQVIFADGRRVNQGMTDKFVEEKQKLFACIDPSKSRVDQEPKNKPGNSKLVKKYKEGKEEFIKDICREEGVIKRQHKDQLTGEIWRQWGEGPSRWKKEAHSPLLAENQQAHSNAMSRNRIADHEVIDTSPTHCIEKWQRSHSEMDPQTFKGLHTIETVEKGKEAASNFLHNRGKMTSYHHFKAGTSPSSKDWMKAQVETFEKGVEGDQWDHAGARKVHYPLRNYKELYVILDLNGVLIKRWDENPSLPGIRKLNKKWIQLRPGCIEFLQKAFSFFRVGIWSTMTKKNVLSVCKLLEEHAHQSLPFFMLWSKDSCYQLSGVQRPDKSHVIADFKPLSHVWGYFKPYLGFHNTVLVDDSPYKACMNNPYNCIFPDAFEGCTDDKYLKDVLWPYLERMRLSQNIQAYIANNPLGQPPIVVGHELYCHVRQVIDVFDYVIKAHR